MSVFLDGQFAIGLTATQLLTEALSVGQELSQERVSALRSLDETGKATDAALRLLAQRPRSIREMRDRLTRRGFSPPAIDAVVDKLKDWRYLDDAEFARSWVENREQHRPRGRRMLELELRQKGIDRDTVEETIAAAELDEDDTAMAVARAKLRSYAGLEPQVVRRRLAGLLARRGYNGATVRRVVNLLLEERAAMDEVLELEQ